MLPFMREPKETNPILHQAEVTGRGQGGGGQDNARKQNAQAHKGAVGSQHPHPSGARYNDETAEYLTVASRKGQARKTTYLLVFLFCVGVLCLWLMIKKSVPEAASASGPNAEQSRIEQAISRLTGVRGEVFGGLEKIVNKFYEFSDVEQVNVNELAKNPFKHQMYLGDVTEGMIAAETDAENERLLRQSRNMQLLSIMQSEQGNCCMIDDKVLYQGDSIRGFTVHDIGDRSVTLKSEELEIVLKLTE
jgi:preprotein translocase subunit SecG